MSYVIIGAQSSTKLFLEPVFGREKVLKLPESVVQFVNRII